MYEKENEEMSPEVKDLLIMMYRYARINLDDFIVYAWDEYGLGPGILDDIFGSYDIEGELDEI